MTTILFTTDFSNSSIRALEWARLITQQYKAMLRIVHVHSPVIPSTVLPGTGETILTDASSTENLSRTQLTELAKQLEADGLPVQTDWRAGNVDDEIRMAAQEADADLIVTGRHDLTSFFDRFAGSTATDVAKGATCPVLVVPVDAGKQPVRLQTIAYATQLEGNDSETLGSVLDLARQFGASLSLVHVESENQPNLYDDQEALAELQEEFGEDAFAFHKTASRTVSGGLSDYLDKHPADLLVMTTRERGFLDGLLNPSLTGRMLTQSTIPVLVYHT